MDCKKCRFYKQHYFYGDTNSELQSISCELTDKNIKIFNVYDFNEGLKTLKKQCKKEKIDVD